MIMKKSDFVYKTVGQFAFNGLIVEKYSLEYDENKDVTGAEIILDTDTQSYINAMNKFISSLQYIFRNGFFVEVKDVFTDSRNYIYIKINVKYIGDEKLSKLI